MSMASRLMLCTLALQTASLAGCYTIARSSGGGEVQFTPPREVDPAGVALPDGYRIEVVATGLTFPTGLAFDDQNRPHIVEAGYSYGEVFTTPRLLRVEDDGELTAIAAGGNGPWNGVAYHEGDFYIADGDVIDGGRIVRIDPEGEVTALIEDLPSVGDHHTNGPAIGPDGRLYFSVGTATNSGVVGTDNADFGWLARHPDFHDIPARDITLTGRNFTTEDPLTGGDATTGAFSPFGTPTESGQTIPGQPIPTGAILAIPLDGDGDEDPEVVAWGLRNPFGLAFAPDSTLYATDNMYDVRGSRPVWGAGDLLWRIEGDGRWYGWPDYHGGIVIEGWRRYQASGEHEPRFLLAEHPNSPPAPVTRFGVHSAAAGMDFSTSRRFGHAGQAFVAEFGDMAPAVGKVIGPVGFKVVRVDPRTGVIHDFAVNRGDTYGPATNVGGGGLERPVAVRFDNDGEALYVVDFGVMTVSGGTPDPHPETGVLWRITRDSG